MLAAIASLLLAGCGNREAAKRTRAAEEANLAAPAPAPPVLPKDDAIILGSETVDAVFTDWEMGDFAWAELRVGNGREISARVAGSPIDMFLTAHVGAPLVVTLETVRAKTGGAPYARIVGLSSGGADAETWWAHLSPSARTSAQAAAEAAMMPIG